MLKSAMVAMTILGCNCEQNTCEYIRTADLELASVADCQARMKHEIEKTNAEYPLIVAVCEKRWDPAAAVAMVTADAPMPTTHVQPVGKPAERTILVRARDRYFALAGTARDGLGVAADFVSTPAVWLRERIAAIDW